MWGKLAQGLKDNAGDLTGDLRSGLAKLSDVVAPPPGDDDDSDEYEEYDEDEYEEEEEEDRPRIGFGAILSRIVAPEAEEEEEEESEAFMSPDDPVEDFQQQPVKAVVPPIETKPAFESIERKARTEYKPVTRETTRKLLVPTSSTTTKKLVVPTASSRNKPSAVPQRQMSHMSTQSLETLKASPQVPVNDKKELIAPNGELKAKPAIPTVDPAIVKEKDSRIQQLEQKCRELELKQLDPVVIKEKEENIRQLEKQCQEMQAEREQQASQFHAKESAAEAAVKEKESKIQELEATCQEMQMEMKRQTDAAKVYGHAAEASVATSIMEKDEKIEELDVKCQELQLELKRQEDAARLNSEGAVAEVASVVHAKDERIVQLEATCEELQLALKAQQDAANVHARDTELVVDATIKDREQRIDQLEATCQEMQVELKRQLDAATLQVKDSSAVDVTIKEMDETISVLESKCRELEMELNEQLSSVEAKSGAAESALDASIKERDEKIRELESKCENFQLELKQQQDAIVPSVASESIVDSSVLKEKELEVEKAERKCRDLELQLEQRETHMIEIQRDAAERMEEEEKWRETQLLKFKQEQAAMLEANSEEISAEYGQSIEQLREELAAKTLKMNTKLSTEREQAAQTQRQLEQALEKASASMAQLEIDRDNALSKHASTTGQELQKHQRAARAAEEKLTETTATLNDRNEELQSLKIMVKELNSTMRKSKQSQTEYEGELEHLREENETLHHNWQVTEDENEELKKQLDDTATHVDVIGGLKLEIQKLKDEKDRESAEIQSKADNLETNKSAVQADLDAALATIRDLEHQLSAASADIEVAKADMQRAMLGNENLSRALESFQSEHDAEMSLLDEQRTSSEEMIAAAHAASIQATHEANNVRMREVQYAADKAVQNIMQQLQMIQAELEEVKKEKSQTRRSLDEAISRLQASQEDVVDRSVMKNVLLDWFNRSGKSKDQVLEMMASLLHFTEDEKEKVHLYDHHRISKVMESVTKMPPAASDVQNLEGDNVRDKFVNFLLAESADL
jgi:chromosome segregation ATPase